MPDTVTSHGPAPRVAIVAAGVAGIAFAGTIALWAHFGTAVFYEMILAGIAACF
jgi:hypothetical protein